MNTFQAKASRDPLAIYRANPNRLQGLCNWREARSEGYAGMLGVTHVVRNRCAMAPEEGFQSTATLNILKPFAFSSFNVNDPEHGKFPQDHDPSWDLAMKAATSSDSDPTDGAIFYHDARLSGPPSAWGTVEHTVTIGRLSFYRKPKVTIASSAPSASSIEAEPKAEVA